jgi:hypothetical protein
LSRGSFQEDKTSFDSNWLRVQYLCLQIPGVRLVAALLASALSVGSLLDWSMDSWAC